MHEFQTNTLIQFFNFWRLLHVSKLMDSSSGRQLYTQFLYVTCTCIGISSLAGETLFCLLDCVYICLPEEESMRFEMCKSLQKLCNWIKVLILNVCISLAPVTLLYKNARCKKYLINVTFFFIQIHYQLMHIIKNTHSLHFKKLHVKMSVIHIELRLKIRHVSVTAIRPSSGVHSACAYTTPNVRAISHTRMWLCVTCNL
jgi:hypothetical protein